MPNFDEMKFALEAMTGGKNTIVLDDVEMPSVMVLWQAQKNKDLITGGSDTVHLGSIVNDEEKLMYVSKYQNIVVNDRAYSLPMRDPRTSVNIDQAVQYSRNKGKGWGLMPYSLWCAIALWCKKNNTIPRGNNNYGCDHTYTHEKGVPTGSKESDGRIQRTLTGSGPASWYHNWMPDGIADLNGNVYERCAGMRLNNGEIQIIPYANCMDSSVSLLAGSDAWKAIDSTGNLVEPGNEDSLKWDWVQNKMQLTNGTVQFTENTGKGCPYKDMTKADGLEEVPELAKILLLYPDDAEADYGGDWHYVNTRDERLPVCGGHWLDTGRAGVFFVYLGYPRTAANAGCGFRSAYCELTE